MNLSSERPRSELVARFIQRNGALEGTSGESLMYGLIRGLSQTCPQSRVDARLQFFLKARNVRDVGKVSPDGCHGALQALGRSFSDGFRITVDERASETRRRFTLAHEICHTFFYELVPEIKFTEHQVFEDEERLCDAGAGELLMPQSRVRISVRNRAVCIETLSDLADKYSVSITAMLLRLRLLGLWRCELTEWHVMLNGAFALRRVVGGAPKPWEWDDDSLLTRAWNESPITGVTRISYMNERGIKFCRPPIRYQVMRFGDRLIALWGPDVATDARALPLFD